MNEYEENLLRVLKIVKKQGRDAYNNGTCSTPLENPYIYAQYEISDHEAKAKAWREGWREAEQNLQDK